MNLASARGALLRQAGALHNVHAVAREIIDARMVELLLLMVPLGIPSKLAASKSRR